MADAGDVKETTVGLESPKAVSQVVSEAASQAVSEEGKAEPDDSPLTFLEVLGSTFSAAIGVQSKANRTRDFSRGKPQHFILAGVLFAALFVVVIVAVVRTVLSQV